MTPYHSLDPSSFDLRYSSTSAVHCTRLSLWRIGTYPSWISVPLEQL
ncbi:unnamed protein product, partial [Musa textilis]